MNELQVSLQMTRDHAAAALEAARGRVVDQTGAAEACAEMLEAMRAEEEQLTAALDAQNASKVRMISAIYL